MADQRKLPPDLAALLRQKKVEEALASKPRFIPKKERERLQKEQEEKEKAAREAKEASRLSQKASGPSNNGNGAREGRLGQIDGGVIPTGPRAMRQTDGDPRHGDQRLGDHRNASRNDRKRPFNDDEQRRLKMENKDEAELRAKYMGPVVNQSTFSAKKKKRRTAANKFNFDWDPDDDTSRPFDPVYAERVEPLVRLGGYDVTPDEVIQRKAELIRQGDPETGQERARHLLEQHERAKKQAERKNLGKHWSEKTLDEMKERDWRIFKENFGIATKGGAIPNPMRSWQESPLPPRLLKIVADVGYDEPTPIQRAAIPIAMQSRDLIGVAVTGSGKTAAFLLPLLVYISELPPLTEINKNDGPYALILAPTRELVQQIESEARKFATPLGFTVVSIVGGHSLEEQAFALRNGAEIIVATPGRLVDCLERRLLVFSQCCYIVMDEADRMIDQGFEEPLTKILDAMPVTNEKPDTDAAEDAKRMSEYVGKDRYRQTMMYTATMPPVVEKIAKKYLRRPAIVTIGNAGEAVDTVEQRVEFVAGEDKRKRRLQEILNSGHFKPPIIVFVNIKRNCDMVARDIKGMGFSAVTLHGSKTQEQREAALASLRNGQTDILVATDLAGRGIDVPDVSLVVNFNMAMSIESYTHRIGRTGRAGKSGVAITFLGPEDNDVLYDLRQIISKSSISKVPEELRRHEAAQSKPQRGGHKKGDDASYGGKGQAWN